MEKEQNLAEKEIQKKKKKIKLLCTEICFFS